MGKNVTKIRKAEESMSQVNEAMNAETGRHRHSLGGAVKPIIDGASVGLIEVALLFVEKALLSRSV